MSGQDKRPNLPPARDVQAPTLENLPAVAQRIDLINATEQAWARIDSLSAKAFRAGLLPKAIGSTEAAFIVACKGYALGLDVLYAMEHIAVINGKATTDGQCMLALVYKACPNAVVDFLTKGDDQDRRCDVRLARAPGKSALTVSWTLDDAKRAGLLDKPGPWKQYPRAMLRWRAVAEGVRLVFPDVIAGLYLHEEMGANVSEDGQIIDVSASPAPPAAPPVSGSVVSDPPPATPPIAEPENPTRISEDEVRELRIAAAQAKWTARDLQEEIGKRWKATSERDLQGYQRALLLKFVRENPKGGAAGVAHQPSGRAR